MSVDNETLSKVVSCILEASQEFGLSVDYLITMAFIESAFNPKAYNRGSGAAGLYQFLRSTAKAYKLLDAYDIEQAVKAACRLTLDNKRYLKSKVAVITDELLYLAHQQGMGGAWEIYSCDANNANVSARLRANMAANGGKGMSASQFLEFWKNTWKAKRQQAFKIAKPFLPNVSDTDAA